MPSSPTFQHAPELEPDPEIGRAAGVPGKSTLTSRLAPRPIFRLVDRDGRDASRPRDSNGVAAGADVAVDRAAASSGAPLPGAVQRRFESSLGADLSSVRVHTGPESADAAGAVGAKAYATGQDIHFAAGAYQPDDPFGMHLLAHEVAHTVQQAGGPATRQHKLEVSAPSDSAEVEADRAADAMVAGAPFAVGAGASTVALHRAFDDVFAPAGFGGGAGDVGAPGDGPGGLIAPGPATPAGKDPYQHKSWLDRDAEPGRPRATLYFPVDSDRLDLDDNQVMRELTDLFGDDINSGRYRVRIVGYADPRYADEYNQQLSERRATNAAGTLRMNLQARGGSAWGGPAFDVRGRGEDPIAAPDAERLAEGRRVEIFLDDTGPVNPAPGRAPEEPKNELYPLSQTWRLKVKEAFGAGMPLVRGGGGNPLMKGGSAFGLWVVSLRIEDVEHREKAGMDFAYQGLGLAGLGYDGESAWSAPFRTRIPVHVYDFAGTTSHYGVSLYGVAACDVFVLHYPEGGEVHVSVQEVAPQVEKWEPVSPSATVGDMQTTSLD